MGLRQCHAQPHLHGQQRCQAHKHGWWHWQRRQCLSWWYVVVWGCRWIVAALAPVGRAAACAAAVAAVGAVVVATTAALAAAAAAAVAMAAGPATAAAAVVVGTMMSIAAVSGCC